MPIELAPFPPLLLILGALAVFAGALVQASTGLGLGMIAAPILLLIDPRLVPGPLLVLALLISLLIAGREWRAIDRRGFALALTGRVPGTVLAGLSIAALPTATYGLLFGVLILLAVLLSMTGWRVLPTSPNLLGAGFASGYMGTLTSVGAPPLALAYQHGSAAVVRATMAAFFAAGSALSLAALAWFDQFSAGQALASIVFVPPLFLGFWAARRVVPYMSDRRARRAVLWLSGLSAAALIVRALAAPG